MAGLGGDALFKRLLTGLLAAGGGAAIYLGYKKWVNRSLKAGDSVSKADDAPTSQKTSTGAKKPDETKAEDDAEDVAKSDPTPALQPEPISSNSSSGNNDPESLSVSGTFEKVSLSTFQERVHESEDPALHSPSESFEKVSLPSSNNEASDLHSTVPSKTGLATGTKPSHDKDVSSPKVTASSASADVKKEPVKPEKETEVKFSSSLQYNKPPGLNSGAKATHSSVPETASKDVQKVESLTGTHLAHDEAKHSPADVKGNKSASENTATDEEAKDEDGADEEEADEEEEEEEEGSSSDASADSQVKDDDGQATSQHKTTTTELHRETTPESVDVVIRETTTATLGAVPRETKPGSVDGTVRETKPGSLGTAPQETKTGSLGTAPRETRVKSLVTGESKAGPVNTAVQETTTGSVGAAKKEESAIKVDNGIGSQKLSQDSRSSTSESKKTDSGRNPETLHSEKAKSGSKVETTDVSKTTEQKSHPTPDSGSLTAQVNNVHAERNLDKHDSERAASKPDRTSSGSPGNNVLYDRRTSATSLTDVENVNLTKEKLNRCMKHSSDVARNGHVFIGHPVHKDKCLDFGMRLSADKQHIVEWIDGEGLAHECGVSVGDELLTVNNMSVTRWKSDVLLKLLSIINVSKFELTLSPSDGSLKTKGLIRHITINLTLDKNSVKVKPIITDMSSDYHIAPPIELGALTPKCCFFGKPEIDTFLMLRGSDMVMSKKSEDTGPFEMMRLLYNRKNVKGYQPPVTMLAFCHNDVMNYICTTDRNTVSLMSQSDLQTKVDSLDVADCRFFSHKFVAGFDCFESTQYPDHYLSCEGEQLSLKYISNSKLVSQERSVHFKLHYRPVSQTAK